MNLKIWLAIVVVSIAPGLNSNASAMTIHDFGKMNDDDEATYVTLLVEGSAKMFKDQGQPDQAHKIVAFFKVTGKPGGVYKLGDQIKQAYAVNVKNGTNPNNRTPDLLVEDAMAATLKAEGFAVPASYLRSVSKDFRPVGPPRGLAPSPSHP
jgi:hypothetical protein